MTTESPTMTAKHVSSDADATTTADAPTTTPPTSNAAQTLRHDVNANKSVDRAPRTQSGMDNPSYKHGLSGHPLYGSWYQMTRRCLNENHSEYRNYGGRGVSVFPEWLDVAVFIEYIEETIGPRGAGMSLDRINNDGNYEPGNVRWATRSEQQLNQRQRVCGGYPLGSTGYRGVSFHAQSGRYRARVHFGRREKSVGYFDTAKEAARAYDVAALALLGEKAVLNFPEAPHA